jgi:hypothetical protein
MDTQTIAIDFDGVIADSDTAKLKFAREEMGLNVTEEQIKHHYFLQIFGEARGDQLYRRIIRTIYHSERMLEVALVAGAREGLAALENCGWRYVVITSRAGSVNQEGSSAYWGWKVMRQNGIEIEKDNFINVNEGSKLEACLSRRCHGLVDDDYSKLVDVIAGGLQGFLFTTRTNRRAEQEYSPFLAKRVDDWAHLAATLIGSA